MDINIMLIGIGPHARRIYIPLMKKYQNKHNLNAKVAVDIKSCKEDIESYLKDCEIEFNEKYYVDYNIKNEFKLDKKTKDDLYKIVKKHNINSIILSTDPLAHKAYIEFGLENGIHILTDKPITTESYAAVDPSRARKIFEDYKNILEKYKEAEKKNGGIILSCLSQRRFHPAVNKIKSELERIYDRTNCGVTSIICEHSDGQWRMPDEVINTTYHGYNNGVGKCSHSGYHFFDIMHWFYEVVKDSSKKYDKIVCYSNFIKPKDWITQLNFEDYRKIFGKSHSNTISINSQKEFIEKTKDFGEIDAHVTYSFYKGENKILNLSLSLLHNGFSRRSWQTPKENLYKGNGRIRHEYYSIHQGPFQSIKYESYQSDQIDNNLLSGSGLVGGELHSDVLIFRNSKAVGVDMPPMEKIQFGVHNEKGLQGYSRGHQEDARGECFKEFILGVKGEIPKGNLKSSIINHIGSVLLMSLAYLSGAKAHNSENPIATYSGGILS